VCVASEKALAQLVDLDIVNAATGSPAFPHTSTSSSGVD
jgi:hypothetical protein